MEKCLSGFLVKVAITFLGRQSRQKRAYIITNPKTLEGKSPSNTPFAGLEHAVWSQSPGSQGYLGRAEGC